jgi:hypothetical protein
VALQDAIVLADDIDAVLKHIVRLAGRLQPGRSQPTVDVRSSVGLASLPQKAITESTGREQLRLLAQTAHASQETLL